MSRSGRRSLGYNHTGEDAERQDVNLQLWLPELQIAGGAYAVMDNPATPYVDESVIGQGEYDFVNASYATPGQNNEATPYVDESA